ncbi:MAG: DUF4981 domain-containing protein [Bacteroidales bacterium]|nr:DUF4981 domain-containing protein [Bacteroidales bacterium]
MKRILRTAVLLLCAALAANARAAEPQLPRELSDPEANSAGRNAAHTHSVPLSSVEDAFGESLIPASPYVKSLNGDWKISWCGDPARRPADFFKPDYDDSGWQTIDVPSCVEMRGFGVPGYTNVTFPFNANPPFIEDFVTKTADYNPVSSYRTDFTVPEDWEGRRIILRFDGVYSAYCVWVNGRKAGYAEDAKLPSEFDITDLVKAGVNKLAVQVFRWCDGSYLEDQDMFRFSGIFRDVTLIAVPADGVADFFFRTELVNSYRDAKATLSIVSASSEVSANLYDASRRKVASFKGRESSVLLRKPHLWSAEDPYLYTLVVRAGSDIRSAKVGIRQIERSGSTVLVNGRTLKFKGVNRHEHSAVNGRTVSADEMLEDILLMKRNNVNTVRTSHYPNHHLWYDLCDRYGIYVIAEANVEGHGMGYDKEGLGRFDEWDAPIVERNVNNVLNYRNHPSVMFWSLGNETGHGKCFEHAAEAVRGTDPTRLVHWERGNKVADVDSRMYPSVEWLEFRGRLGDLALTADDEGRDYGDHTPGKPFFLCEYAHAMGNAIGNLKEYWDAFYSSESLLGGCIWDWVDQGLLRGGRYVYGGDYDEIPNDGPFCCNGVIRPDRKPTAKLAEVAHVYRQIAVSKTPDNRLEIWNRFSYTPTGNFDAKWVLLEDGIEVASDKWRAASVKPLGKASVNIPDTGYEMKAGREYFLNVYFTLKEDASWAPKGHVVASDQIALDSPAAAEAPAGSLTPHFTDDGRSIVVTSGSLRAEFCRSAGTIVSLKVDGREMLAGKPGSSARLSWMRAFTDNDIWLREGDRGNQQRNPSFYAYGLSQPGYHAGRMTAEKKDDGSVEVCTFVDAAGAKSAGFEHTAVWTFATDGTVTISNRTVPYGRQPKALPRFGLSFVLDGTMENAKWYGRGPRENYIDRNSGSFIGVYASKTSDLGEEYIRPQDNGYRSDVRWVEFTDDEGRGVRFSSDSPLFFQALHNTWEDLEFARHRNGQQRFDAVRGPREEIYLNLDLRQLGLGGASCGPRPMDKYVFPIREETWTLRISPVF